MNYFKHFPQVPYRFSSNGASWSLDITDITRHAALVEKVKQQITAFHSYVIQDGERPDTIATKVYGSPEYTWIILVVNNILTLFDWPLTEAEFSRFITNKYGSLHASTEVLFYLTTAGDYVDSVTYALLPTDQQGGTRNAYEDEILKNEAKRAIRVLPQQFVGPLQAELQRAFV